MANYAFKTPPDVENGHTFREDNFCQMEPHTAIFAGKTGLKFIKCNLINCDIPADAVTEVTQPYHLDFCSNIHPKWIAKGLAVCAQNCSHVVSTDTVTIDGVLVDTIYHYEDGAVQ